METIFKIFDNYSVFYPDNTEFFVNSFFFYFFHVSIRHNVKIIYVKLSISLKIWLIIFLYIQNYYFVCFKKQIRSYRRFKMKNNLNKIKIETKLSLKKKKLAKTYYELKKETKIINVRIQGSNKSLSN